jgi:predicted O-methyltransferase YrrM
MPNFNIIENGGYSQARPEQLGTLEKICCLLKKKPPVIAEVGCWTGVTTSVLASYAKWNGGLVYAVDWFNGTEKTDLFEIATKCDVLSIFLNNMSELGLMNQIKLMKMKSEEAVSNFKDGSLDLVFIDADHRYAEIKKDIDLWYPKVANGGILCGHDCEKRISDVSLEFLQSHVDSDYVEDMHPGVILAVGERFPNCNIENDIWWIIK